jgi:putative transcriptional regulator
MQESWSRAALESATRRDEMKKAVFEELLKSVKQAGEIAQGKRAPSRTFKVDAASIKDLRSRTNLSQPDFATLLCVEVSTLRNWEQGRREPTGPAKALLRAIRNDPENVLKALVSVPGK